MERYQAGDKIKRAGRSLGIIIQARMGSKRLPGKVLKKIGDKTLLEHIFYRLLFLRHDAQVILATSDTIKDDVLEEFCIERDICCFRGSEHNVLERYYLCAREYGFFDIVRLTGDNPFTDIEELDNLIDLHLQTCSDYTSSLACLPVGVGGEIFTLAALEKSYYEGREPHHIEHVDEYILENPGMFKLAVLKVDGEKNRRDIRLTIDTEEDYSMACRIFEDSKGEFITTKEAISIAKKLLNGTVI